MSSPFGSSARVLITGEPFFVARFQPLVSALHEHWPDLEEFEIVDRAVVPRALAVVRAAVTGQFWPPTLGALRTVRDRFDKSPATFARRSAQTERAIAKRSPAPDLVLQFFAMSSPSAGSLRAPYAHYVDMTMAFVRRLWPAWTPFATQAEYDAWIAQEGRSYRDAARVFTFSETTRQSVINDYGASPERVVAVGAAGHFLAAATHERTYGSHAFVFNGSDFERKGGDLVLEAFAQIRNAFPDATLTIVGTEKGAGRPGVSALGNVTREKLFTVLDRTDIVLAPSRLDVLPGFAIESMSRGVVPIVSDCPSMSELLVDGVEGYVVSPTTAGGIAARAIELLSDSQRLATFGRAARARVERDWNWPAVARRMIASLAA